jgi:hypothetical protein
MNPIFRTINFTLNTILRSPLHRLISRNLMLITVTGRKSRQTITVPVVYQQHHREVRIVSERADRWWRNVRGGAPVILQLHGQQVTGQGQVIEEAREVLPLLMEHLHHSPTIIAKILNVKRNDQGQFNLPDLHHAAERSVVVCVQLQDLTSLDPTLKGLI